MGQQQSKDELLFQQVNYGNTEGIKALHREGAGLEWIDRERKTPLVSACMNPGLYNAAKTLIELGANINAYRPGRHAGTPLHHAAKRGLENTVKLLLSHGANALVMNDDCQTPLEVAREKGHSSVVRAIEDNICLFSGWMREFHGPGFLELLAPQFVSRKVWVVVLPSGSRNAASKAFKLELAIYTSLQEALPRMVIQLWKANMEEPKPNQSDPTLTIFDNSTIPKGRRRRRSIYTSHSRFRPRIGRQTRIKLASANEGDWQQLRRFSDACKGIPSATHPMFHQNSQTPISKATMPQDSEDLELAMALSASLQSAMLDAPTFNPYPSTPSTSSNGIVNTFSQIGFTTSTPLAPPATPSAPPLVNDGPIHYPINTSSKIDERKDDGGGASSCVICLDAPSEAVCVPCGHAAGCMSCLNEVKASKMGCPVCRANIDQVIKLYRV